MLKKLSTFLITLFYPLAPARLVYMLQQVDYSILDFMQWLKRMPSLVSVQRRKKLDITHKAKLLLAVAYLGWATGIALIIYLFATERLFGALLAVVVFPIIFIGALLIVVHVGRLFVDVVSRRAVSEATIIFKKAKAQKIAVLGSYGKTTVKDMVSAFLGEKYNVASTPGNQNVLISQAKWALSLKGNEDFLIVEFGEYKIGDIRAMSELVRPDEAVITGYAPNHLSSYKSENNLKQDLAAITNYVELDNLYVPKQTATQLGVSAKSTTYTSDLILGWKVAIKKTGFEGTVFSIERRGERHELATNMLGTHLIPSVVLSIELARQHNVSWQEIEAVLKILTPYEHRMQPKHINGAWIIDDTYNGNLEGIRSGLSLLTELPAKRRIYVTPGLVEQGEKTKEVHEEIGRLIAQASPDRVVLMKNSVTNTIVKSLKSANFGGDISVETNPLDYYQNLDQFVASGDVVLMQNDWTDNYN